MTPDDQTDTWLRSINDHLGERIRQRRKHLRMSQTQLGEALGLTFQQVQKYEHGSNRISAARLLDMARVLKVPLAFFYDELSMVLRRGIPIGMAEEQMPLHSDVAAASGLSAESVSLARSLDRIADRRVREQIAGLIRVLGLEA